MGRALLGLIVIGVFAACWMFFGTHSEELVEEVHKTVKQKDAIELQMIEIKMRKALDAHSALSGSYPESLDDVEDAPGAPEGYEWDYDPESGSCKLIPKQ